MSAGEPVGRVVAVVVGGPAVLLSLSPTRNGLVNQESLWRIARRAAFRTWRRDLLAIPVVWLLVGTAVVVLYGRDRLDDWGVVVPAVLLGCVAWPVALWLLDRIFGRYHTPS